MEVGIWISGCVSGVAFSTIVWVALYLIIETIGERRSP